MNALVKMALGLKKGVRGFQITFGGEAAEHFYLPEGKTGLPAPGEKLDPVPPPLFLFGAREPQK
jgi:hypothetical protein